MGIRIADRVLVMDSSEVPELASDESCSAAFAVKDTKAVNVYPLNQDEARGVATLLLRSILPGKEAEVEAQLCRWLGPPRPPIAL